MDSHKFQLWEIRFMHLKRKNDFKLLFDPSKQPGAQTRCASLQKFLGGAGINVSSSAMPVATGDSRDLRKVFRSGTVWQTLPSSKLKGNK